MSDFSLCYVIINQLACQAWSELSSFQFETTISLCKSFSVRTVSYKNENTKREYNERPEYDYARARIAPLIIFPREFEEIEQVLNYQFDYCTQFY